MLSDILKTLWFNDIEYTHYNIAVSKHLIRSFVRYLNKTTKFISSIQEQ